MSKKKKKKATGRTTPPRHTHLYVGRVIRDAELGTGMVTIVAYRDNDQIQISDHDEFVTFMTVVPLFDDGLPEGGETLAQSDPE